MQYSLLTLTTLKKCVTVSLLTYNYRCLKLTELDKLTVQVSNQITFLRYICIGIGLNKSIKCNYE